MKKTAALLLMGCMTLLLAGCGAKKTVTVTSEQNGMKMEMKLDAKDDEIQTITQTSTLTLEGMDVSLVESIKEQIKTVSDTYKKFDGADYDSKVTDEQIVETITIDASDSDTLKKLSDEGLLPVSGSSSKLSLEKTKKSLTDSGWKIEE